MGILWTWTVILSQSIRPFLRRCLKAIWRKSAKRKLKSKMLNRASILPSFWERFCPTSDAFQTVKFLFPYSNSFNIILQFIASNVLAIYELAIRFQVEILLVKCERILRNCFEIPFLDRFFFADKHSLRGLTVYFWYHFLIAILHLIMCAFLILNGPNIP